MTECLADHLVRLPQLPNVPWGCCEPGGSLSLANRLTLPVIAGCSPFFTQWVLVNLSS